MRLDPLICNHCGCELEERKKRSPSQHRMFFASVAAAFANWPITHSFRPSNEEHLRAYLLVRAGHCNIIGQNLLEEGDIFRVADFTERLLSEIRSHGGYGFVEVTGRKSIIVNYAKSINWREVDQKAFQPIAQAVFDIIEAEIGVMVEDLVTNHEAAA